MLSQGRMLGSVTGAAWRLSRAGARWRAVSVRRMSSSASHELVVLDYKQLAEAKGHELHDAVAAAYGYEGLGILAVTGVPGYEEARRRLLPLARRLGHLPPDAKARMENADSFYNFGWSEGRELVSGVPDTSKGSFYANPIEDAPFAHRPDLVEKHPSYCAPNVWPAPEDGLPELEPAFKALARLIVSCGGLVAAAADRMVAAELQGYEPRDLLERTVAESPVHKARLLYYFPRGEEDAGAVDAASSWCGWHNDHGSLTGLAAPMYMDDATGDEVPCPDEEAGLFVRTRQGQVVRVVHPEGALAFQIGETAQIHTGGVLQATPHAVGATATPGVSRATLAVFMQPHFDSAMAPPAGSDESRLLRGTRGELLPPGVPPLAKRWSASQTFGEFTVSTLSAYH